MRQHRRQLVDPRRIQRLERLSGSAVQVAPARNDQGGLGHILGQRVLEHVDRLLRAGLLVQELKARELEQMRREGACLVEDGLEHAHRECAAQYRGGLKQPLRNLRQPVDAGHQDPVDGVGDRDATGRARHLLDDPGQLLEEKWIALGFVEDDPGSRARIRHVGEQRAQDRKALVGGQRPERELGRVGAVHPGGSVSRPVGREQEDAGSGQTIDQRPEVGLRGLVDPVEILHHQDHRP
jgi:hypothetical protein